MRRRFMNKKDNKKHLSFIALEDGMSITFTFNGTAYYSVNNEEWKRMESGISTEGVKAGSIIYVKGYTTHPSFEISKKCKLSGFCASILYGDEVSKDSVVYENCFSGLFENCTTIVEVDNILPATTLAAGCYSYMFGGCTSLTTAPELPATTLATGCYSYMFGGCTSLTTAPELPATTLAYYCYGYMFYGCTSLNYIKMLATNISAFHCLYNWVRGVASTGTFVKNSAMTSLPTALVSNNYVGIPSGWTVVNDGEESGGGSKTINYIRMSYNESGPDEYNVTFKADFIPASTIIFEMGGMTTNMGGNATIAGLTMVSGVPTLERLTYSPKEDDTYIYEVIWA